MDERIAVVTGAGSGIGRAVAIRLVKRGYRVFAAGRSMGSLIETGTIAGFHAGTITPVQVDVADGEAMRAAFSSIGRISVLIANAGVCKRAGLDDTNADSIWKQVMSTNADGVWNTFRVLSDRLEDNARAVVVSSGLGKLGRARYGAYTASKHAVLGLVKCFARELASRRITVNAVCPGWVRTEMSDRDLERTARVEGVDLETARMDAVGGIPLGRFVEPSEVASLIDWLTCKEAGAITGQSYNISCGELVA